MLVIIFDLIVALSFPIGFSVLIIKPVSNNSFIIDNVGYYLWLFSIAVWFFLYWIIVPFLFRGYTLFKWIFRIRLDLNFEIPENVKNNRIFWFSIILKNQIFTSIAWIIMIFLSMALINPELAYKIAASTPNNNLITSQASETQKIIDQSLLAIPSTYSAFLVFISFFILISSGIRKDKTSLADAFSKTKLVYVNKFEEAAKPKLEDKILHPIHYEKKKIIFLEEEGPNERRN